MANLDLGSCLTLNQTDGKDTGVAAVDKNPEEASYDSSYVPLHDIGITDAVSQLGSEVSTGG